MKRRVLLPVVLVFLYAAAFAQPKALQFKGKDCNGDPANLYADLDSGKAVFVFIYMPFCDACPPPAKMIQQLAKNINARYPGKVKGYAFPNDNSGDCMASISWVGSSGVGEFFIPMDSGLEAIDYYGGFGMPTVVLAGGKDHRIMFRKLGFNAKDTAILKDSILYLLTGKAGIKEAASPINSLEVFPSPAQEAFSVDLQLAENADVSMDILDITGRKISTLIDETINSGQLNRRFSTEQLPNGIYSLRILANGTTVNRRIIISH